MPHDTVIVGVVTGPDSHAFVLSRIIRVDTLNALSAATEIILAARSLYPIAAVFLDGVTYAGFNVIDPYRLASLTHTGSITVFRYPLELDRIRKALANHFGDWRHRYEIISYVYEQSFPIVFPNGTHIRVTCAGIPRTICEEYVREATIWMPNPEPLRLADLIASAIGRKLFEVAIRELRG